MGAPRDLVDSRMRGGFPRRLYVVELDVVGAPDIASAYYPARDGDGWVTSDHGADHPDVAEGAEPVMLAVTGVRATWRLVGDVWELDDLRVLARPPAGPGTYTACFAPERPQRWPGWVAPLLAGRAP